MIVGFVLVVAGQMLIKHSGGEPQPIMSQPMHWTSLIVGVAIGAAIGLWQLRKKSKG